MAKADQLIVSGPEDIIGPEIKIETNHDIYFEDAINIRKLKDKSIHLIITSPPYWQIKDYGHEDQIGFHDSLIEYFNKLKVIWKECVRVLKPGCKLCINIGDQFLSTIKNKRVYQIIPLHSLLVNQILDSFDDMVYLGTINWNKVTTSNTSGGGKIMGSIYYPRNGYFFINREYIAIFRKLGKDPKPISPEHKEMSRISIEEWREFFKDTWTFPGVQQTEHDAMFPDELPRRLIRMYSFIGDTVLDPFFGSGTTTKNAAELGRNSVGFEIGFNRENWKEIVKQKIESGVKNYPAKFNYF